MCTFCTAYVGACAGGRSTDSLMQDQNETNVENLHSCIAAVTGEQGEDEVYDNAIGSVII